MQIDYGLQMLPGTVLRIADTEKWLLQPELKAIKEGLEYGIKELTIDGVKWSYRGYLNANGQSEGVGIRTFEDRWKSIG
jgi:hypothetical protein